jgi:3',5'-cyclic-AMP phosphodiesterase
MRVIASTSMKPQTTRREFLKELVLTSATLAWAARVMADTPLSRRVTFGLISDVHQDIMPDAVERIRAFADAMTKAKADFVLQLGDFCQPKPANRKFLDAWNSFAGPRYHVLGNHDMDGGFMPAQTCAFLGSAGPYYAFTAGPVRGLVLNGNEPGGKATGYKRFIGAEQLAWLERELARTDRPVVIFIHQPMDDSTGISIGLENTATVRAVIEKAAAKVVAVFSGHFHMDYGHVVSSVHHIQINSASYLWLGGGKLARETFPTEVHNAHKLLKNVAAYREPLWALVTLDFEHGTMVIEGKRSEWIGPDPWQRGATKKDLSHETTRPAISDRRLRLEQSVGGSK